MKKRSKTPPSTKPESRTAVTISISVKPEMPEKINQRIRDLGISRSLYIAKLMARDLVEAGLIEEAEASDDVDPDKLRIRAEWFKKMASKKKK